MHVLLKASPTPYGAPEARSQVAQWQALETAAPGSCLAMRGLLKAALTDGLPADEDQWRRFLDPLAHVAEALTGVRPNPDGFLAFEEVAGGGGGRSNLHVWKAAAIRVKPTW